MHFRSYILAGLVWGTAALFAGLAPGVQAQTGPGGVGSTDGASSLELWLPSNATHISEDDAGVDQWSDQSGNGNDASRDTGDPQLLTNINTINDHPAVAFDGNDGFTFSNTDAGLENVETGANTVFVVSTREGTNADGQYILSIGDDDRLLGYDVKVSGPSPRDFVGLNKGDGALLDDVSTNEYVIASSLFLNNGAGDIDALFNAGE